jgi:hypothetical protein
LKQKIATIESCCWFGHPQLNYRYIKTHTHIYIPDIYRRFPQYFSPGTSESPIRAPWQDCYEEFFKGDYEAMKQKHDQAMADRFDWSGCGAH